MILKVSSYQYCYLEMICNTVTGSANVSAIKGLSLFPLWFVLFEGFERWLKYKALCMSFLKMYAQVLNHQELLL